MPNSDPEGLIFLSAPNNHDRFFSLHTFLSPTFDFNVGVAINEWRSYVSMSAILKVYVLCDVAMTSTPNVLTTELRDLLHNLCINVLLFVFYLSYGWIRVCKNRFVSTGENRGKPRLVCKKRFVSTGENRGKPCLVCKKYPIGCWTVTLVTECSIRTSQPLKILIIKLHTKMCNVRTYLHTNIRYFCPCLCTYENVIWPNLCYTQKYDIFYLHFFTYENM